MNPRWWKKKDPANGIILIADIGPSSSCIQPCGKSFAELTNECIHLIIRNKIFLNSDDEVVVILSGSYETNNPLFKLKAYENIEILDSLKKATWDLAKTAGKRVKVSNYQGNWMDSLTVALNLINRREKDGGQFQQTQIVLFSNLMAPFNKEKEAIKLLTESLFERDTTELLVIGSNITEELLKDKDADSGKFTDGELVAKQILEKVRGSVCSFEKLIGVSSFIPSKKTKPAAWNATLDIGSKIRIPISGYIKVKKEESSILKWQQETSDGGLVERKRTYNKGPTDADTVDKEDVIWAYKYGSKYIPFSNEDEESLLYKSGEKCLSILSFTDAQNIPPYYYSGESTVYILPRKNDRNSQIALSALVQSMEELGKVAIVRRVYQRNSSVCIGALSPRIKLHYEALIYHQLPFADDYRHYYFPPVAVQQHQPTKEQLEAVDQLIDQFDLLKAEEQHELSFNPNDTHDPYTQYAMHVLAAKALHPEQQLPPVPAYVDMLIEPPQCLSDAGQQILSKLETLFPLEAAQVKPKIKVENVALKRGTGIKSETELESDHSIKKSRLDSTGQIDLSVLLGGNVVQVGTATPIRDFQTLLQSQTNPTSVYRQMESITSQLLRDSGGSNEALMRKSADCLREYRCHCITNDRVDDFNRWIRRFKDEILYGQFHQYWKQFVGEQSAGLITNVESPKSLIGCQEAELFLKLQDDADGDLFPDDDDEMLALL